MNNQPLSAKTEREIQKFVQELSLNSGILAADEMTYLEEVKYNIYTAKQEMKQNIEQFKAETKNFLLKLRLSSAKNEEFQEEILTHISDYVRELVVSGVKEEEALDIVFSEFQDVDFSELNGDKGKGGIPMMNGDEKMYEAIGVFYAGFLIIGGAVGFILGSWVGAMMGALIGIGLGNVSHGITAILNRK